MSNFYRVLGVAARADDMQIKVAFRRLAKACHPDLNPGDGRAEQRFREINRAYEILRDPAARALYDRKCADDHARRRRRWQRATLTMSACFAITVISGLLVAAWMQVEAWNLAPSGVPQPGSRYELPLWLGVSD